MIINSNKIGLDKLGIIDLQNVCYNFSSKALVEDIVKNGEGIIGIGYRVSGEAGKANVLVNPLSVLTPGFLRRVFEIGIGLGDVDNDPLPELDEPDLTE